MSRNQIRIEFTSKTPFAGGKSFGSVGPYERLLGMVSFAVDPDEKDLPFICDLEFAPRNADGLVEFKTVLDIVKPVDLERGNRKLLFDFSNRGGRGAFTRLNDGGGPDLSKESYAGNGFLNRQGFTVVTVVGKAIWFTTAATLWLSCRKRAGTANHCVVKFVRNSFPTSVA